MATFVALRTATGELTWINAGHPNRCWCATGCRRPAAVRAVAADGPRRHGARPANDRLQPADRLLVCTDGVFERRDQPVTDVAPLADLLVRTTLDELSGPEIVRRFARAVLDECGGDRRDDDDPEAVAGEPAARSVPAAPAGSPSVGR